MTALANFRSETVQATTGGPNGIAALTIAAPGAGLCIYVATIVLSFNAAITTAASVTVSLDGTNTTLLSTVVAAAGTPQLPIVVPFWPPLKGKQNTAVIVTVPASGAGVSNTIFASYFVGE